MSEYRYFKVNGGAVRAAYDRWAATRLAQNAARNAVKKEFGADGTYGNDRGLGGLVFEKSKPPADWVPVRGVSKVFKPNAKTAAGRAIKKRIGNLPMSDAKQFQIEVMGKDSNPFAFMEGLTCRFMVFEFIGDTMILLVPKISSESRSYLSGSSKKEWQPADDQTVEMKNSEYWQLKEAAEQNQQQAKAA